MFRRSVSTAVTMMAAESHYSCCSASTVTSGVMSDSQVQQQTIITDKLVQHSQEMGFASRAVKVPRSMQPSFSSPTILDGSNASSTTTYKHGTASSFIATQDGQRLGVATGSQVVKSMRKYCRSNNHSDIHGGCDWTVLSCTPTSTSFGSGNKKSTVDFSNLQFCIAASQKGSSCATTVCRGSNGSIAYHSQPKIASVETNYFYARPNDYVMMHSSANGASSVATSAAQALFQSAVKHAARMSGQHHSAVNVETLAEEVMENLRLHGEEATVVIARLGFIDPEARQPPATA